MSATTQVIKDDGTRDFIERTVIHPYKGCLATYHKHDETIRKANRLTLAVAAVAFLALATLSLGVAVRFGVKLPAFLSTKEAWVGMVTAGSIVTALALLNIYRERKTTAVVESHRNFIKERSLKNWQNEQPALSKVAHERYYFEHPEHAKNRVPL